MNREIKFRAWDKKEEKFDHDMFIDFEGDVWYYAEIKYDTPNTEIDYNNSENRYEIVQFTGLKDKNGTEIYEGDIVEFNGLYEIKFGEHGVPNAETGSYQDLATGFYFKAQHDLKDIKPFSLDIPLNRLYASECEVLGNIFENPELLERDEE